MASEEPVFESADAGASLTTPISCGALRKGAHVMIKGHPCKIIEITTSKTGKHGHAKAHIIAIDIFTEQKREDLCPTSHNMEQPIVVREEYQLLGIDEEDVSVLLPTGDTKDDLNMPKMADGSPAEICEQLTEAWEKAQEDGKDIILTVMGAMGKERIVSFKESTS